MGSDLRSTVPSQLCPIVSVSWFPLAPVLPSSVCWSRRFNNYHNNFIHRIKHNNMLVSNLFAEIDFICSWDAKWQKNRCDKVDQSWYSRLQNLINFEDNISSCIKNVYQPAVATIIFCLTHRIYSWGLTPVNQGFRQSIYRLVIIFSEFNVSIRLAISRCFWHWQIAGCCKLSKTSSLITLMTYVTLFWTIIQLLLGVCTWTVTPAHLLSLGSSKLVCVGVRVRVRARACACVCMYQWDIEIHRHRLRENHNINKIN